MYINDLLVHIFFLKTIYHITEGTPADVKVGSQHSEACFAHVVACEERAGLNRNMVCGTNGRTYLSRCDLMKAQCSGETVNVARRGPCLEGQLSCLIALRYALKAHSARVQRAAFVPRCRADGTYAPVQCAANAGCWCVSADGKNFPNTTVRNSRPDCTKTGEPSSDFLNIFSNL